MNAEGRIFIWVPLEKRHLHPTIRRDGYIQRYVYVWNIHNPDDPMTRGFIVHHKNEDRIDDRIENLERMTQSEHARLHLAGRRKTSQTRQRMKDAWVQRKADT